ncbi:UDP-glycosyltransferase 71K1-like [Actinidia eriantha]|uniref:UDP-glycosyltransferase 71K1-like n=1 Tax=Actinidia eriantha TaxID=165200 RepID=UPI00258D50CF|nr:UDP-glycosyltransferase 71K1-like [Actinidia eriantha]
MMKKRAELVFVPAPGMGHLVPTVEFVKHLLDRDERLSVTILVIKPDFAPAIHTYTQALATANTNTRIRYIHLPQVETPHPKQLPKSPEKLFSDFLESYKSHVESAITDHVLSSSSSFVELAGLVVDFFCSAMIDVANKFGVPSYIFFPSSAAFLGLMLYLPDRHTQIESEFNKSDPDYSIPSYANPVPTCVLPSVLFNEHGGYTSFLNHARRFRESKGIIINTFAELETYAMNSFSLEALPVYTVGPLVDLIGQARVQSDDRDKIMKWLDEQPPSSVIFLCFGSFGSFSPAQLVEMASGLEQSGLRFLWSIRLPPPKDTLAMPIDCGEDDYEVVLPDGFLKRTKGRGMVCGWAPQVEVLAHKAVGGFVSHCGWNSTLESLWFGVPIVTWPIYAEQQINAFEIVRELGLGVELRLDYSANPFGNARDSGDLVTAAEIERAVRCVMDTENVVRERVREMGEKSRKALVDGGSSFASLLCLVEDMLGNN